MAFHPDGRLVYTLRLDEGEVTVPLVYTAEAGVLRTDNPDAPNVVEVPFHQGPGDTLVIEFPGSSAVFVREAGQGKR